jgi:dolichyl-phosphate beta-glucosyltransferase
VSSARIIVPCGDESIRIDDDAFISLVSQRPALGLLFLHGGSSDDAGRRLHALAAKSPKRFAVRALDGNVGKGEAVRQGLVATLQHEDVDVLGYLDADLSTPVAEVVRLLTLIDDRHVDAVLAARVAILGCDIARNSVRHYLGRAFATVASTILRVQVYDTQCGAKFFRRSRALEAAVAAPFVSQSAFDVELIGRLLIGAPGIAPIAPDRLIEEPLQSWRNLSASPLRPIAMLGAARDLILVAKDLAARRARNSLPVVDLTPIRPEPPSQQREGSPPADGG